MLPASAPPWLLASPEYYERLGRLQLELRDSEKKRLDLEKKLYEYSQSDIYRVKLKYVKLKKYLKEICESEKMAHTRNQEYLKQSQYIQAHIGQFTTTSTEKLQELKIEYEAQFKKLQLLSKDSLGIEGELKNEDREKVAVQAGLNSETAMPRGLYQPATSFLGRQMSAVSSIGDFSAEQKSPQPTKNISIPDPHSHQQTAQNCNVTDSHVVQTHGDTQCFNKSDKIDGKASLQIGEKMLVTASVLSAEEQTHCLEIGSNTRHGKSNLSEGKNSAELHSPLQERLSPENRTTGLQCDSSSRSEGSEREMLTQEHIEVKEDRASPPVSPLSVSEYRASESKCSPNKHSAGEVFSDHLPHADPTSEKPFRRTQEEWEEDRLNSSSALTVSVSEDDLLLKSPELQTNPGDKIEGEDGIEALRLIRSEQERDAPATEKHNCILQTLSSPDSEKESSANSPTRQLCNHSDIPKEDLEDFEAAVLPQLLRLSPLGGSDGKQVRPEQTPALSFLGAPLSQSMATFKEEQIAKMSEIFQVKNVDQRTKATALLKRAPTEEGEDRLATHSNESSCSSPSIRNDNPEIKEPKYAPLFNRVLTWEQEISSGYRDETKEESMAANVPITETKVYQWLKQSVLQDNTDQTEDRIQKDASASQLPGLNIGSGAPKTTTTNKITSEASFSSSERSPLSSHENKKKLTTNLKSKAFWDESDDTNSEIEAALRPRDHSTSTDDFGDFYD